MRDASNVDVKEGVWVPMQDIPHETHSEMDLPPYDESHPHENSERDGSPPTPRTVTACLVLWYIVLRVCEQLKAVVPISLFLISFRVLVFGRPVDELPSILIGLSVVVVGLTLFIEGLKFGLMPLGEELGRKLPLKLPLPPILLIGFILGISVTIAEPAVGALATLGSMVPRDRSPYLSYLLTEWSIVTMLAVGVGVGIAAVVGILRLLNHWSLKTLIYITLIPTVAFTCILNWTIPALQTIVGLAWDCGAVTTGPVTVPIVLALGLGVSASTGGDNALAGFGIVTLASLFPIIMVQILALFLYFYMPADDIRNSDPSKTNEGIFGQFPFLQIYLSVRAIVPLVVIMVVTLKFIVRENLPSPTIEDAIFGEQSVEKSNQSVTTEPTDQASHEGDIVKDGAVNHANEEPVSGGHGLFLFGLLLALVGMALFNIGLARGLSPLGSQSGEIIPSAFQHVDGLDDSPRFSYGLGIAVVIAFAWVLGFLATVAEPALYVLGITFQRLTRGQYSARTLIYAVSFGVGTGITLGVLKIIYHLPLVGFIVTGYAIALPLTIFSDEDIVSVAWDSAGVTTGPVTVPFVLTLGVSLGKAVGALEGFGILMLASVGPIISVLTTVFLMKLLVRLGILAPSQPQDDVKASGGEHDPENK